MKYAIDKKLSRVDFEPFQICFNRFQPISPIRFWGCQILFVAAPALVYVLWSAHVSSQESRLPYILRIVSQLLFETGFLTLQWILYGKYFEEHFHCNAGNETWRPCVGTIECYISRPQEKNIFLWYMYGSDAISIALTVFELALELVSGPTEQTKTALPTTQRRQVSHLNNFRLTKGSR